jgi:hypothetical protein
VDLTSDERTRLAAAAADRAHRQVTWLFSGAILIAAATFVVPLVVAGRTDTPLELVLLALPVTVFAIILVPFYRHSRRRGRPLPLAVGADRRTRTEVQRAIRARHTADRRIDALVRDLREYHHRSRWQTLVPAAVAVTVGLLLIGLFDHPVLRIVMAFAIVLVVAALWRVWLMHRRLVHYRGLVDP